MQNTENKTKQNSFPASCTDLKGTLGFYPETENKIIAWRLDSESERVMAQSGTSLIGATWTLNENL